MKAELPMNVHLLTLSALRGGDYLLRLEHQFELDEGTLGKPVNVSLSVSLSACTCIVIDVPRIFAMSAIFNTLCIGEVPVRGGLEVWLVSTTEQCRHIVIIMSLHCMSSN